MPGDNTEEIKLQTGDSTTIKLNGLATAGYEWNYTVDSNKELVTISKDFVLTKKPTRNIAGNSAEEVFTIKANKKGFVEITFFQHRNWEKNVAPVNEKKIKVIID